MASQVTGWAGQIEDDDGTLHALGSTAYGYCQTAAATAAKVVDMTGFKLVTGATIFVKFQYANSVANPTLNVNGTGAKVIYRYGTTRPSTNASTNGWPAGAVLAFTYDGSGWQEHYWYNNQYTLANLYHGSGNFVADSAVYRYQLLFHTDRDTLTPLNNNDNVTGTTKTMLTNVDFDPFAEIYYYNSTTNVAAGGAVGGGACYWSMSSLDMRYSFNCGDSSLTAHQDVYLKCSRQANGMFRIASASPLTQVLPSGNDGYYYIQLGRATSGYQMTLHRHHPIYYHDGTALRIYTDPAKAVPFAALAGAPTDNSALSTALAGKAAADHNHDGAYAAASHNHDDLYYTESEMNTLLAAKQDTLTFDSAPTAGSANPVTSGGVKTALDAKQDTLTFDTAPTANSTNPVTSGGVKTALDGKVSKSGDTMSGNLIIENVGNNVLRFIPVDTSKMSMAQFTIRNNERLMFWHRTSGNDGNELYLLPAIDASASGNNYYDILTSKNPVTVAQGGTGGTNSGVKTLSGSAFTGTLSYQTIGKFGMVSGQISLASNLTANYIDLQTLPAGSRPSTAITGFGGNQNYMGLIYIYTSGVIRFYKPDSVTWGSGWNIYFSFSYFVA